MPDWQYDLTWNNFRQFCGVEIPNQIPSVSLNNDCFYFGYCFACVIIDDGVFWDGTRVGRSIDVCVVCRGSIDIIDIKYVWFAIERKGLGIVKSNISIESATEVQTQIS